MHVPPNLDRAGLEEYRRLAETQLLAATEAAEMWAASGQAPEKMRERVDSAAA
jgi:hypothetical protein